MKVRVLVFQCVQFYLILNVLIIKTEGSKILKNSVNYLQTEELPRVINLNTGSGITLVLIAFLIPV